MAKETEHCGQKQIRRAAVFCRGRTPTVCANMYTATDFCPGSSSRLQRRQNRFSKRPFLAASSQNDTVSAPRRAQVCSKFPARDGFSVDRDGRARNQAVL